MKQIAIPRCVDEPPTVLLWSPDEIAPLAVGLVLGMLAGQAFLCTAAGILASRAYKKYVNRRQDGFLCHWLYWHGFFFRETRTAPNPFVRVWY